MEGKKIEELVNIPNKDLIIVLTSSNCYSIVIDNITNNYHSYSIGRNLDDFDFSNLAFDNVNAYFIVDNYTTIPTALFDEEKVKEYLNFTTTTSEHSIVNFDIVHSEKLAIIWELNEEVKTKITNLFSGATFQNLMSSFLKSNNNEHTVNSLFLDDKLVVSVFSENTLQLINCFDIKSVEDALYYHLLLLQSIGVLENEVEINVRGDYKQMGEFLEKLEQYFSRVSNSGKGIIDLLKVVI